MSGGGRPYGACGAAPCVDATASPADSRAHRTEPGVKNEIVTPADAIGEAVRRGRCAAPASRHGNRDRAHLQLTLATFRNVSFRPERTSS
ncbi:hypothetical protein A8F41_01460 [Burkholderia cenocepacia]|nr:hypothetical protein A8F41_01460 [Burkholderia cenocepacia]